MMGLCAFKANNAWTIFFFEEITYYIIFQEGSQQNEKLQVAVVNQPNCRALD